MADTKVYLPRQTVRRGKAGYKGKDVVIVDPKTSKAEPAPTGKGKSKSAADAE